jgi:hypothetical protein
MGLGELTVLVDCHHCHPKRAATVSGQARLAPSLAFSPFRNQQERISSRLFVAVAPRLRTKIRQNCSEYRLRMQMHATFKRLWNTQIDGPPPTALVKIITKGPKCVTESFLQANQASFGKYNSLLKRLPIYLNVLNGSGCLWSICDFSILSLKNRPSRMRERE